MIRLALSDVGRRGATLGFAERRLFVKDGARRGRSWMRR